jgi:hypothetical protein
MRLDRDDGHVVGNDEGSDLRASLEFEQFEHERVRFWRASRPDLGLSLPDAIRLGECCDTLRLSGRSVTGASWFDIETILNFAVRSPGLVEVSLHGSGRSIAATPDRYPVGSQS